MEGARPLPSHSSAYNLTHHHGCDAPRVQVAGFGPLPSGEASWPGIPGLWPRVPPPLRAHPVQEPQHAHQHRDQMGETEFNPWEGDTGQVPQEAGVWGRRLIWGPRKVQKRMLHQPVQCDTPRSSTRQEPDPKE